MLGVQGLKINFTLLPLYCFKQNSLNENCVPVYIKTYNTTCPQHCWCIQYTMTLWWFRKRVLYWYSLTVQNLEGIEEGKYFSIDMFWLCPTNVTTLIFARQMRVITHGYDRGMEILYVIIQELIVIYTQCMCILDEGNISHISEVQLVCKVNHHEVFALHITRQWPVDNNLLQNQLIMRTKLVWY